MIILLFFSRLVFIIYVILFDILIPDHDANVDELRWNFSPGVLKNVITPFTKWDSVHFLKISHDGYLKDHLCAFFPLYPMTVKHFLYFISLFTILRNKADMFVIIGLFISNCSYIVACIGLWKLCYHIDGCYHQGKLALIVFLFNPANIFFTTVYTESLYSFISFSGVLFLHTSNDVLASICFLLASSCRSNGILNIVFIIGMYMQKLYHFNYMKSLSLWQRGRMLVSVLLLIAASITPFYIHNITCSKSLVRTDALLSNDFKESDREFMNDYFNVYQHVQHKYWSVGLLQYYHWKQIPNFCLVIPMLLICGKTTRPLLTELCRGIGSQAHNVFRIPYRTLLEKIVTDRNIHNLHLLLTVAVVMLVANVQILTRVVCCSCPIIYVGMAEIIQKGTCLERNLLIGYLVLFNLSGGLLHPNFFPWT